MEIELEPRVKSLSFKVKGMSKESPSQKATHVLDTDLRSHWSTATNTKEWILLELDEPCLLSHIRIYNKSVLEWEIAVGLRYKPEAFVKVRPRCEAPRRDMVYPMNYTPCRYVRISCLRGNPIAIFFIQLIGVSMPGLEPEFQPVVNHLLPHILSHKQEPHDMHLQLLQDVTKRLLVFVPQLEADLSSFLDTPDSTLQFLAMLAGPYYPILQIVNERETARSSGGSSDSEASRHSQSSSLLTVSSNFEPRRSRGTSTTALSTFSSVAFRPNAVFLLLRKAHRDSNLGAVCRMASRILHKLVEPVVLPETSAPSSDSVTSDGTSKYEFLNPADMVDYSSLFGEEFQLPDYQWDYKILNILDIGAVEEGIFHVLYACAAQPLLCSKLSESQSDIWSVLPLVQALLPALRPHVSSHSDNVDDTFSQWRQTSVQQALSQIVLSSSSPSYHPLLHACAGYLSSFSPSHAKAACTLIDLCSGVLAPWIAQVIAKIDLTMELLEDLLGTIQGAHQSMPRARASLKYIVLALSGNMDDMLDKYKVVKHKILFLLEILEPFLDPVMHPIRSRIAFGNISTTRVEKKENNCLTALKVIRTAIDKPAVLPSLESEWKRGSVSPSVLLNILEPHIQLPPEIDLCKYPASESLELEPSTISTAAPYRRERLSSVADSEIKADTSDMTSKTDIHDDISFFFAPPELRSILLTGSGESISIVQGELNSEEKSAFEEKFTNQIQNGLVLDTGFSSEYFNLQADYCHLVNFRDCELRALEFKRLALDLTSQKEVSEESHDVAIDAFLLAAECYVNPFFVKSFKASSNNIADIYKTSGTKGNSISEIEKMSTNSNTDLQSVAQLEKNRDKIVLQLLLEAAELDREYKRKLLDGEQYAACTEGCYEQVIDLSPTDMESTDAVTMVRQHQALLCSFLIQQLKKEQNSGHEILLQCLVFLLHSATKLFCASDDIIDIIFRSAEYLDEKLTSFYFQSSIGNLELNPEKVHEIQRRWMLLQKLVIASSGSDNESGFAVKLNYGFQNGSLIPPLVWMQRISRFSSSTSPLVRFLGWMAISRVASQFKTNRFHLVSDLPQLTTLLSIYADDLAVVDNYGDMKLEDVKNKSSGTNHDISLNKVSKTTDQQNRHQSFQVIYPDLGKYFPNMKKQFEGFGEIILEAVGLQLRLLPSTILPDILCWFSDLCSWPFSQEERTWTSPDHLKGYAAKNAKAIILYILEAIVSEHMEAMVPEIPRVVQVLVSLSRALYCDVSFLDSILRLLKPIVSFSLHKVSDEEKLSVDGSCLNFESLCFNELLINISKKDNIQDTAAKTIFILASVFPDLSHHRKREMLQSLILWADFSMFEPTTSLQDYLHAFQSVMESCKVLLIHTLRIFGLLPLQVPPLSMTTMPDGSSSRPESLFLEDVFPNPSKAPAELENHNMQSVKRDYSLSAEEIEGFTKDLKVLIVQLNPTIERCWNLHHQLTRKLTITSAECFVYLGCLSSHVSEVQSSEENGSDNPFPSKLDNHRVIHWKVGLKGLAETIATVQEKCCWEVASLIVDCLVSVPPCFNLDNVNDYICSAIKKNSYSAPKLLWRLQTDKWLSILFARAVLSLHERDVPPLVDLFCSILGHAEPEQRLIGLQYLGKLVQQDVGCGTSIKSSLFCRDSPSSVLSVPHPTLALLVSSLWDQVIVVASSDTLLATRICAMSVLVGFIPFASTEQLQAFLGAADKILHGFGTFVQPVCEGPILQLSLALIATACLYSSADDVSLIPQNVWNNIETLSSSKSDSRIGDIERKACQVLCRLRNEGDEAKEVLREVLSSNPEKQIDPDFNSARESILQVLSSLTSAQAYFDLFSKNISREITELEEAEIELDIIKREQALQEPFEDFRMQHQILSPALANQDSMNDDNRIQKIKDSIQALEKSRLKEEIIIRRQEKLLVNRSRQKYLEEAALREAELLQELDRERTAEAEKEIERQRVLEVERAKSRELRHQLEMEKERQTQKELQRELEQAESGFRSSRRDVSLSHSSRPRERFRERDNGRLGTEGGGRTSVGNFHQENFPSNSSMPSVVLSGSRSFSGQPPTILQSRDRFDECSSNYEENQDGSRDSGDAGSVGDPELASAFDGQSGGYGSAQRHGSRGSKSRQVVLERPERDGGRRQGKWERKH